MLFESDESSLWPIISSIGTYNCNLVKFLTELLDPVIPKEHRAKDSFRFSEEIQQVSSNDNILVSYNVCSLFESMTLQETIEIEVELIFENNAQLKVMKRELKRNNYLLLQPQVPILFDGVSVYQWDLPEVLSLPICSWAITKRNGCENLTKERFSCINVILIIFFVCLEMKRMQKIFWIL